jgi:hypothetical protein
MSCLNVDIPAIYVGDVICGTINSFDHAIYFNVFPVSCNPNPQSLSLAIGSFFADIQSAIRQS